MTDDRYLSIATVRSPRANTLVTAAAITATAALLTAWPQVADAAGGPAVRCGRAVVAGNNKIVRTDARALSRCTLAVLEQASSADTDEACSKLRTPGLRLDRIDNTSRSRIGQRCRKELPAWLPAACPGPGPAAGASVADADALAYCVASSAHCQALSTLDSLFDDAQSWLRSQHPDNLRYLFGGLEGNSFESCMSGAGGSTTTTTLPGASTTTTVPTPTSTSTTTTTLPSGGPATLVITEIMANPAAQSDTAGEYFEILNAGGSAADLSGMEVMDLGSDSFTVDAGVVIAAGERVVFGKSEMAAGGAVDYVYGTGMSLTNSSDEIVLVIGGQVADQVAYDGSFPVSAGRAMEVTAASPTAASNDVAVAWCASDSVLADGDFGTPRAAAGACLP